MSNARQANLDMHLQTELLVYMRKSARFWRIKVRKHDIGLKCHWALPCNENMHLGDSVRIVLFLCSLKIMQSPYTASIWILTECQSLSQAGATERYL